MTMLDDRLLALVREYNPWWEGVKPEVPLFRRELFARLKKYAETKQITAVVGLRRVGKTIMLKQLIWELLGGSEAKSVFYFSFDEIVARNPAILEDIIGYYIKNIAPEGRKYVFLDEIQKVMNWQEVLKRFYDSRGDLKFVISGSASLEVRKSKESLAGRMIDLRLPVLTFHEFLEMNGLRVERPPLEYGKLREFYEKNIARKQNLEYLFLQYVFRGAFPEIAREEDEDIIRSYVKNSVLDKIIFSDIPSVFEVKRKDVLSALMEYCSRETSHLLNITNLAKVLGVNYQTLLGYIFYLQSSFVIDIVYNYSGSIAKQLRKNKKIHIAHPSFSIAIMRYGKDVLGIGEVMGGYVESLAYRHIRQSCERVFFWRTAQKDEVDIVIEQPLLPVEVKYKSAPGSVDMKSIMKFMRKHGAERGVLVTKDTLKRVTANGKEMLMVPAWLFLLSEPCAAA